MTEQRLAEIEAEAATLRDALRELGPADAPNVTHAGTTNGTPTVAGPNGAPIAEPPPIAEAPPPKIASPLELRIDLLREQHGPVFVIQPTIPVSVGQKIKWRKGQDDHTVEILEDASSLPGPTGKVITGGWFAKILDL